MDFHILVCVFTNFSIFYPNIPSYEDYMLCISCLLTIVDRQSGFKFLICMSDNFIAEQCTAAFNTHVIRTVVYPNYMAFDYNILFQSYQFQNWAACRGIKLEPATS